MGRLGPTAILQTKENEARVLVGTIGLMSIKSHLPKHEPRLCPLVLGPGPCLINRCPTSTTVDGLYKKIESRRCICRSAAARAIVIASGAE